MGNPGTKRKKKKIEKYGPKNRGGRFWGEGKPNPSRRKGVVKQGKKPSPELAEGGMGEGANVRRTKKRLPNQEKKRDEGG